MATRRSPKPARNAPKPGRRWRPASTRWISNGPARPLYSVSLSGFVEARDIRQRTDRFVLRVTRMEAPRAPFQLARVRLSVRKGTAPDVGSFVELKARLQPPF